MSGLPEFLTVKDLAEKFKVSRQTIYTWIANRGFPAATHRIGGHPRWQTSVIMAYLDKEMERAE